MNRIVCLSVSACFGRLAPIFRISTVVQGGVGAVPSGVVGEQFAPRSAFVNPLEVWRLLYAASSRDRAAAEVVLSTATLVVKDRLNGGWGWWVGIVVLVFMSASVTALLTWRTATTGIPPTPTVGPGAIHAERDISNSADTDVKGVPAGPDSTGYGAGSISAGRDITGPASTKVDNTTPHREP